MISPRAAALLVLLLAVGAACAFPRRDNPHDPVNAPGVLHVLLRVIDFTPASGGLCPAAPPLDVLQTISSEVSVVSRGRCLALDAGGSTSTAGTFTFVVLATDGSAVAIGTPLPSLGSVAVLDAATRHSLPTNRPISFGVVQQQPGAIGNTTASLVLLNGRPVARHTGLRSLPLGGRPWNVDPSMQVAFFDGGSYDPDGNSPDSDPLLYCWTLPGASEVCSTNAADPAFSMTVSQGRVVARLVVKDGIGPFDLASDPVFEEIDVEPKVAWLAETGNTTYDRLVREENLPLSYNALGGPFPFVRAIPYLAGPGDAPGAFAVIAYGAGGGTSFNSSSHELAVTPLSGAFSIGTPLSFDFTVFLGLAASRSGGNLRVLQDTSTGIPAVHSFVVAPSGGAFVLVEQGSPVPMSGQYAPTDFTFFAYRLLRVDDSGNTWIALQSDLEFVPAGGAAQSTVVTNNPHLLFSGADTRPGSDELWTACLAQNPTPGQQAGARKGGLFAYQAEAGAAPLAPLFSQTDAEGAFAIAFIDHDTAWIDKPTEGLLRVDISQLEQGVPFELAVLDRFPSVGQARDIAVDAATGVARGVNDLGEGFRAEPGGALDLISVGSVPLFVDPDGFVWSGDPLELSRGRGLNRSGFSAAVGLDQLSNVPPVYDPATGGMWGQLAVLPGSPTGLAHVDAGGIVDRVLPPFVDQLPFFRSMALSPDGTHLWAVPSYYSDYDLGLWTIDLTAETPTAVQVLPDVTTIVSYHPSAPVAASTPFVWLNARGGDYISRLQTLAPGGTPVTRATPTVYPGAFTVALSPKSNSLCVVQRDSTVSAKRISTTGAVVTFPPLPISPTSSSYIIQGEVTAAEKDVCWVVTNHEDSSTAYQWTASAFRANGTLLHQYISTLSTAGDATLVSSMVAVSADELWLQLVPKVYSTEAMVRLTFAPGSTATSGPVSISTLRGGFVREDGIR